MRFASLLLTVCAIGLSVVLLPPAAIADPTVDSPYCRAYATAPNASWARSGMLPFAELVGRMAQAQVVFLGEQHGDIATHRLQLAVLQELHGARTTDVVLAMEQFERDVQAVLDAYLAGSVGEEQFLSESRPWPNYERDYRPLVEYCRVGGIPVVAGNVPRPLASRIAREGFETAWAGYSAEERPWVAAETTRPQDVYWWLFKDTMSGGGSHGGMEMSDEMIASFYAAQCLKDDTMAESVARVLQGSPAVLVLHTNGSFHSDYGLGTPARVAQRVPGARILTVAIRPVRSWSEADPWAETLPQALSAEQSGGPVQHGLHVADYVVFVPGPEFGRDEAVPQAAVPPAVELASAGD